MHQFDGKVDQRTLIAHINLSNPSRGHLLALGYIQKKIQKTFINSHNAFCECWHELFFERGILNYITKNISDEIQDWYMRSLERVCSDNDKKVNIQEIQMILHRLLICILTCIRQYKNPVDVLHKSTSCMKAKTIEPRAF